MSSHKELKGNTGSTVTPSSPVVFTVGLFTTGSHPAVFPQRRQCLALEPLEISHGIGLCHVEIWTFSQLGITWETCRIPIFVVTFHLQSVNDGPSPCSVAVFLAYIITVPCIQKNPCPGNNHLLKSPHKGHTHQTYPNISKHFPIWSIRTPSHHSQKKTRNVAGAVEKQKPFGWTTTSDFEAEAMPVGLSREHI